MRSETNGNKKNESMMDFGNGIDHWKRKNSWEDAISETKTEPSNEKIEIILSLPKVDLLKIGNECFCCTEPTEETRENDEEKVKRKCKRTKRSRNKLRQNKKIIQLKMISYKNSWIKRVNSSDLES